MGPSDPLQINQKIERSGICVNIYMGIYEKGNSFRVTNRSKQIISPTAFNLRL